MGADEKGARNLRSFNLFDALVIGVLFIGIPLSFWAYSSRLKGIDKGERGGVIDEIPGQRFAREAFRVTLLNDKVLKSMFSHMKEGETIFGKNGRHPIGVLREFKQIGPCWTHPKANVEVCTLKLTIDMRCVESENTVRCSNEFIRVNDNFHINGKLYKFDGRIVDIKRLGTDVAVKPTDKNP